MVKKVILRISGMIDNYDEKDQDFSLWKSIAEYVDGQKAYVIDSYLNGEYVFLGLVDEAKNKELHYMMEQDSMTGCFIDNRKKFEVAWDSGEYEKNECWHLKQENIEFL